MEIKRLLLTDALIISLEKFKDQRGYFQEVFNEDQFQLLSKKKISFIQINESYSNKFIARGMHLQKEPYGQNKIVRVTKGKVLDIIIDLRKSSQTFMKYEIIELNESDDNILFIPNGFAHGFISLSDKTIFNYIVDSNYMPSYEAGFNMNDQIFGKSFENYKIKLSKKDQQLPSLKQYLNL